MRTATKSRAGEVATVDINSRARILAAAERLFAERGHRATSIRELARQAEVNVAAINYHFGSKENLYVEVLRNSFLASRTLLTRFEKLAAEAEAINTPAAAVEALRGCINELMNFLFNFNNEEAGRHASLMAREMADPSPALDVVVEEFIRPKQRILVALIEQARPDLIETKTAPLFAVSIVSQCLHYFFAQPIVLKLLKRKRLTPELVRQLADHIGQFSLRGLTMENSR